MAPTIRRLYIASLVAAAASSPLAADRDKQPAPSQPTPAIKRMNEEAGRHVPGQAPAPAPATRAQAPTPSPPTPSVRRMGPAGTGGVVNPPGWDQMTPQERERYRRDLEGTQSPEECRALMQRQEQAARQRSQSRGLPPPGSPGRDLCARY
jgi:hypothetical protein